MLRVLSCLAQEHDFPARVVAGIICLLGSFTTFGALEQTRRQGANSLYWFGLAAIVAAAGIWRLTSWRCSPSGPEFPSPRI